VLLFSLCVLVGRNGEEIMDSLTTLKIENLVAGTASSMLIWRLGTGDQGLLKVPIRGMDIPIRGMDNPNMGYRQSPYG
jgi:hypothetical protein